MVISGIILVPAYLAHIPRELYGAWLASGNILFWISGFDLGVNTVVIQRIGSAYGRRDVRQAGRYLVAGVTLSCVLALGVLIAGGVAAAYLPQILNLATGVDAGSLQAAFALSVVGTALIFLGTTMSGANQALQGSVGVGLCSAAAQMTSVITIVLGLLWGYGVIAIGIGMFVRGVVNLGGNLLYLLWRRRREWFPLRTTWEVVRDLTSLLGFSSLGKIGLSISTYLDALLVSRFIGQEAVISLVLTKRGPEVARALLMRPGNALVPAVTHIVGEGGLEKTRAILLRFLQILFWISGLMLGGFAVFNQDFIRLWVGEQLYPGWAVNMSVVGFLVLNVVLGNLAIFCNAMGDIKRISVISFLRAILCVILFYFGGKYYGLVGIAAAPLVSTAVVSLTYVPRSFMSLLRLEPDHKRAIRKELLIVVAAVLVVTFAFKNAEPGTWLRFGLLASSFTAAYAACVAVASRALRRELAYAAYSLPYVRSFNR